MDVIEFYDCIQGNYQDAYERFQSDVILLRFIKMFESDQSYETLIKSISSNNVDDAFRAAHTIKGTALNLGFDALANAASNITEVLRNGNFPSNDDLINEVSKQYNLVLENISKLS